MVDAQLDVVELSCEDGVRLFVASRPWSWAELEGVFCGSVVVERDQLDRVELSCMYTVRVIV